MENDYDYRTRDSAACERLDALEDRLKDIEKILKDMLKALDKIAAKS